MKGIAKIITAILCLAALLISAGCYTVGEKNEYPTFDEGITYIHDSGYRIFYMAFTWNDENYVGKKYAVDGMFKMNAHGEESEPYLFRYSTERHSGHSHTYELGFDLKGENLPTDLEEGTWIRVIGTVNNETHGEHTHIVLQVDSWEKLDKEGIANV